MRDLLRAIAALLIIILVTESVPVSAAARKQVRRPACSDGKDNDGDGKKDYPRDRGCRSRADKNEYNRPPARRPTATPTPSHTPSSVDTSDIETGIGKSLNGHRPFPDDNPWNTDISTAPVDSNSAALIASIGLSTELHPDFGTSWDGAPIGFPYIIVSGAEPKIPLTFQYADESDNGDYPIPLHAPIEGGPSSDGDRHVLAIDKDNWVLYEIYDSHPGSAKWSCGSGAIFDLNSNDLRPAGWTSADAAGLPIFPGLVRYDEVVELGEIRHALRFTVAKSRRGYVSPARHFASSSTDSNLPPMGMRVRLKESFDISGFSPHVQVILRALKKYGMFVADNGSNWFISGTHDNRWNDDELSEIRRVQGRNFEVIDMGNVVTQ